MSPGCGPGTVPADPNAHYEVQPDPDHPGRFRVVNTGVPKPGGGLNIKGSNMSKADAVKQWRLLQAVKHDPGWEPKPGAESTLKHVPGPGKLPGSGYSQDSSGVRKARRVR